MLCSKEVIEGVVEYQEFEMIPEPQEKWLRRAILEDKEAEEMAYIYEEGIQAMVEPWSEWTRQEEKLIESHVGFGLMPEKITHDKSDWPRVNKELNGTMVIEAIEGFYLSHLEGNNPYYAGAYPSRKNPDRDMLLHDNRVPRKHTDQVTKYMGNPTYTGTDRLIYTDIYGHVNGTPVHIRTTNDINTIECAMIHTDKGTVKAVTIKNGYISELKINNIKNIPLLKISGYGFDEEGNITVQYEKEDMDIKGCDIEISYLKEGDRIFDHTRQIQIKEGQTRTNMYIDMRIQSLRNRINKLVDNYKKGYISEEHANKAVTRYEHAITRLKAKRA